MLLRAGILRPAHQAGVFHLLPLGFRVQEKIKKLIDRHMEDIGASRLALSTFASPARWKQSGRLSKAGPELFQVTDRKNSNLILSPTHEEEITALVQSNISSYRNFPMRLYQITRKYRDEARPRKGLLRSREFVMKDLYTFDLTIESALATYEQVRSAYDKIFAELRLPVRVAEASSGDIGGDLSHEYHLPTPAGEDDLISCSSCGYVANSEVAESACRPIQEPGEPGVWRGICKDRSTLVNVWFPRSERRNASSSELEVYSEDDINIHAVKDIVPEIDGGIKNVTSAWSRILEKRKMPDDQSAVWNGSGTSGEIIDSPEAIDANADEAKPTKQPLKLINIVDYRLPETFVDSLARDLNRDLSQETEQPLFPFPREAIEGVTVQRPDIVFRGPNGERPNLLKIRDNDPCPKCGSETLRSEKAIELGHTFHLGTRYSNPMGLHVPLPTNAFDGLVNDEGSPVTPKVEWVPGSNTKIAPQMGCHGIGVSRLIGAVAELLSDDKGLNWPRAIAPYEVVIVDNPLLEPNGNAEKVYDVLAQAKLAPAVDRSPSAEPSSSPRVPLDLIIDDRRDKTFSWKLKDADLIGYPIIVVMGKESTRSGQVEVQCRQLGFKQLVMPEELPAVVHRLLDRL